MVNVFPLERLGKFALLQGPWYVKRMREKLDTFRDMPFSQNLKKGTVSAENESLPVQKSSTDWARCFLEMGDWLWTRGEEEEACEMYQYALRMAQSGHQANA